MRSRIGDQVIYSLVMVVVLVGATSGASTQTTVLTNYSTRDTCENAAAELRAMSGSLVAGKGDYDVKAACIQVK